MRAWPFLNLRIDHLAAVAPDVLSDDGEGRRQRLPLRFLQFGAQLACRYRAEPVIDRAEPVRSGAILLQRVVDVNVKLAFAAPKPGLEGLRHYPAHTVLYVKYPLTP